MFCKVFYTLILKVTIMASVSYTLNYNNKRSTLFIRPIFDKSWDLPKQNLLNLQMTEIEAIAREEFPILNKEDNELKDLIYFNNATTTQKPNYVLNALFHYYTTNNFSVYRGSGSSHDQLSTQIYENARKKVSDFVNAPSAEQILFTSGVTDSINFVSSTWGPQNLKKDDVILLPLSEHNSNLLPWWVLCDRVGCSIEYVKLHQNGQFDLDHLESLLKSKSPKLLCCGHASNVLGVIQDMKTISKLAHKYGCLVLSDSAQTVGKIKIDVQDMDVDFLAGSSHKMYGPTGVGFLYYKKRLLEDLEPQKCGGGTVKDVTFESCDYFEPPFRFEAGTPPVAQAIGLGAAVDFINSIGIDRIRKHDNMLLQYLYERMKDLVNLYNFDPTLDRIPIISFNVDDIDPFDLSALLASKNIITRAGKHCAYLLHKTYYCTNTIRVSLAMYNSSSEVDKFIEALKESISILKQQ
ncbi:Aminotransferase class-V family protein [Theileria parva strain Muguga]|uniref:Aminotransferase class-V family protein n=1 Tax=Theileria parva strain Muguga TaxID=333668 RepID=UPI001C6210B3|nr:Aminotransferase class-V family protein [Theileria parva strain Muguga]KAF5153499.1 Aminotransferase class-V family protein [Theileria parva strain Muguga]